MALLAVPVMDAMALLLIAAVGLGDGGGDRGRDKKYGGRDSPWSFQECVDNLRVFTRSCVCLSMYVFVCVSLYSDLINFHVRARVYFSCEDASIYQFVELHVCA